MSNLEDVEFSDSDEDWEDMEEEEQEKGKERRNRTPLPILSWGCDRFKVPDRLGAFLASCTLADEGLITPENLFKVVDPTKLRRQRLKWGKATGQKQRDKGKRLPGLYTDGLRSATLVRKTKKALVATGKRGKGATREVTSVSNEVEVQDNFPIVGMPGAEFLTHVTPENGTGVALAKELEAVVRELDMPIKVIGMDGCKVNTGPHNGAIRLLELQLNEPLQWVICGLHLNELLWWHILCSADGDTAGPDRLSGPIGSQLHKDVWTEDVAKFAPIPGKVPTIPPEVVQKLSRDQQLAYKYSHTIVKQVLKF